MADQVAQVKERADIVSVVGSRLKLTPAGKYMKGLCPFHGEKSPSFFVSPELQIYKCFGCGRSGDVLSFLQEYDGLSFREALEDMAEKVGVKLESYKGDSNRDEAMRLAEVLHLAMEYYHYLLTEHRVGKEAVDYLKKRGLAGAEIKAFHLGYAPKMWDGLTKYLTGKKGYKTAEIEKVGLAIAGGRGYYDRFRGRIMFPLADFRGRVVGFSGRLLGEEGLRSGMEGAKYVNTPETVLYRKRELLFGIGQAKGAIRKKDKVHVVEGEFDVISSYMAGVRNVVAIKGSALTDNQIGQLRKLTRNLVLCLDADVAGDAATKRAIESADKMGMNVSVVELVGSKDPDEIARGDPGAWKKLVGEAVSVYEFYINSAFEANDAMTGLGKKKISEELAPVLARISNSVERAHYVGEVAKRLGVQISVVEQEIDKVGRAGVLGGRRVAAETQKPVKSRMENLEWHVWGLLFQLSSEELKKMWKKMDKVTWEHPGLGRLADKMSSYLVKIQGGVFELAAFGEFVSEELAGLVGELYLDEGLVGKGSQEQLVGDLKTGLKELVVLRLQREMKNVSKKIGELELKKELSSVDEEKLEGLQREFSKLAWQVSPVESG